MTEAQIEQCTREIHALHLFFQDWLSGAADNTTDRFAEFEAVSGPGFSHIAPDGTLRPRQALHHWLRGAHGAAQGVGLRIWIDNAHGRIVGDGLILMTYEEWQEAAGRTTARLSSALFAADPKARHGVVWLHVQETWLPDRTAT
ncbi:MAG: DUF4440 domain-containing protein [Alphaproteobacteria bacterium]